MSNLILKTNENLLQTLYHRQTNLDTRVKLLEELLQAIMEKVTKGTEVLKEPNTDDVPKREPDSNTS